MEGTPRSSPKAHIFTISPEKEHHSELTSDLFTALASNTDREYGNILSPASRIVDKAHIMFTMYESWSGYCISSSALSVTNHQSLPARLKQVYDPLVSSGQMHALYARGFPMPSNFPMSRLEHDGHVATCQSPKLMHSSGPEQYNQSPHDSMPRDIELNDGTSSHSDCMWTYRSLL